MSSKHNVTERDPSAKYILPEQLSSFELKDPGRRQSIMKIAALTSATVFPLSAMATGGMYIKDIETGETRFVAYDLIHDRIYQPMFNALESTLRETASRWGWTGFMTPEGGWDHGRIRDLISRAGTVTILMEIAAAYAREGKGTRPWSGVAARSVARALINAVSATLTTIIEYQIIIILKRRFGVRDQPAKYAASFMQSVLLGTMSYFMYPAIRDAMFPENAGDEFRRRLSNGIRAQVDYLFDHFSMMNASGGGEYQRYRIAFNTVARHDDDMLNNTALDHFRHRCTFYLHMDDIKAALNRGERSYTISALVEREDNLAIVTDCHHEYGATICTKLKNQTSFINLRTAIPVPGRL